MEFLWVWWLGAKPGYCSSSRVACLPKVGFVEDTDQDAFGFLDPHLIIQGPHLIPDFNSGWTSDLTQGAYYDFQGWKSVENANKTTNPVNMFTVQKIIMII